MINCKTPRILVQLSPTESYIRALFWWFLKTSRFTRPHLLLESLPSGFHLVYTPHVLFVVCKCLNEVNILAPTSRLILFNSLISARRHNKRCKLKSDPVLWPYKGPFAQICPRIQLMSKEITSIDHSKEQKKYSNFKYDFHHVIL